jgi:dihydrofolate reductase
MAKVVAEISASLDGFIAGPTFTFVTGGIEDAVEQARAAAGEKRVGLAGGANVIQQGLEAGLVDELQIHLVPLLLGDGVRLFDNVSPRDLEQTSVVASPAGVRHLSLRVQR